MDEKLKIEYVPLSELKPYKRNAKKHPREQIERIKKSIAEFGFNDPIGIWNSEIVEGHGRFIAAKELGMDVLPVIRLDGLTDEQRRAYVHIHNKLTMDTGFDLDILNADMGDLASIDWLDYGFDPEPKKVVEDNYEIVIPPEPKAKYGDIYCLGRHRLMCGDSTSVSDVASLTDGRKMDMLLTDPPYNVNIKEAAGSMMNDNMDTNEFRKFLREAFLAGASALKQGGSIPHLVWRIGGV